MSPGRWVRRPGVALPGLVCGLVVVWWALTGGGLVSLDPEYSLAWGRSLVHGTTPDFSLGPTPHPLSNLIAAVLSVFGGPGSETGLRIVSFVAAAAVVVGTAAIAEPFGGRSAAVIAGALVLTRSGMVSATAQTYLDVPFVALVLGAAAVAIRHPDRHRTALTCLALAGLLRPEAWFMSGAYLLWLIRERRVPGFGVELLIVASSPTAWLAVDWLLTSDPLFSFTTTREASQQVTLYDSGLDAVLRDGPTALVRGVRPETALAGCLGLVVLARRGRPVLVRALAALLVVAASLSLPVVAGTLLNPRYLLTLVALVCALAGIGAGALAGCARGRVRTGPMLGVGLAASLLCLVALARQVGPLVELRESTRRTAATMSAARTIVRTRLPCAPLVLPNSRLRPFVATWRERPLEDAVIAGRAPVPGTMISGEERALSNFVLNRSRDRSARLPRPPAGARPVRSLRGWTLYDGCDSR